MERKCFGTIIVFMEKKKKYCALSILLVMTLQAECWKWESEIITHEMFIKK